MCADEDNLETYKNDLYRSSHQIIYKQFQQQQNHHGGSKNLVDVDAMIKPSLGLLYEAKPLNVAAMWTSANSSNSLAAVERDQMIDRLSAAIANLNHSMSSSNVKTSSVVESDSSSATNEQSASEVRQISCV